MSRIVGIDLGTSNSCVAAVIDCEPRVLATPTGRPTLPSVVAWTDTGTLVGELARRQAAVNATRTVVESKRLMGRRRADAAVAEIAHMLPYEVVAHDNGDCWIDVGSQRMSPPEVGARILQALREAAEEQLGELIERAVITVPAYFDDAQRQATRDAGEIAGLEVVRVVNEPTAAALAWGYGQSADDTTLVVFDLGGGTFDVSILRLRAGEFEVVGTGGDNHLGGNDFDRRIVRWLLARCEEEHGVEVDDDPMAMQRLREAAEEAKIALSERTSAEIDLPFLATGPDGPVHLRATLERDTFEEMCDDLLEHLRATCAATLGDAGVTLRDVDDVLLVGGMTRAPCVRHVVDDWFGRPGSRRIHPDEAVALGASVHGAMLSGDIDEIRLLDVTPLALGVRVEGDRVSVLISANTPVPAEESRVFTTTEDGQTNVSVVVVQGNAPTASENRIIATFVLEGIEPAPAGEARIGVKFMVDEEGRLDVRAIDLDSGTARRVLIRDRGGLTESERDAAAARAGAVRERTGHGTRRPSRGR